MRHSHHLVFDEVIPGAAVAYTGAQHNDGLGRHDQIAIAVVIDNVSSGSSTFDLWIEHSPDGRNWLQRNDTSQTNNPTTYTAGQGDITTGATLSINTTYLKTFTDACQGKQTLGPLLPYVRFALKPSSQSHVKVYATLRG